MSETSPCPGAVAALMPAGPSRFLPCILAMLLLVLGASAGLPKAPKAPKAPELPKTAAAPAGGADPLVWLDRADNLVAQLDGATGCLESSREALFGLVATSEEKKLLKEMEAQGPASGEDLVLKKRQLQAEVVDKAREEGRFEKVRLTEKQAGTMGRLGSNLLVAVKLDQVALENGRHLAADADDVLKAAKDPQTALRLGSDAPRLTTMPGKLNTSLDRVPGQLKALQALLEAVEQTKANNKVELRPAPDSGGSFETIEEF